MSTVYSELDQITEADLLLLRDAHIREQARIEEVVARVPEGTIVAGHERREVFTFSAPEIGEFRFDVRGIKDAIADRRIRANMFKMPEVSQEYYEHIRDNGGVESDRLSKINGPDLERPGILVAWPNGYQTMIDGNHRLCRRMQLGMKTFRFLLVDVRDCVHWMCRPGDEARLFRDIERDPRFVEVLHTEIKMVE